MDDLNITMEEYIRLEEKKLLGVVRCITGKLLPIVFNDTITSEAALSCEPTVSSLNNDKIDFIISFDESDDEDCTEFPAIVYNDAQTSKLDFLTEPTVSPQHIDEFNLKDKTSLFECDEKEQNFLYFNDLFSFNVIYPDDSKPDKNNDDDKVDIEHSSGDLSVKPLPDVINTDVGAYAHGWTEIDSEGARNPQEIVRCRDVGPNGRSGGKFEGRFGEHCDGNGGIGGSMSGVGEGIDESMGGMGGGSLVRRSMVSNDGRGVEKSLRRGRWSREQ
ncbi:hypothetical protein Tco_0382960 [Tanacetum coccineum]